MGINVLNKIDSLRIRRNWSMYELAENAGIPQSTLSNMFLRGTQPSISTLEKICEAFDITLAEFFIDGEQEISNYQAYAFVSKFNKLSTSSKDALLRFLDTLD